MAVAKTLAEFPEYGFRMSERLGSQDYQAARELNTALVENQDHLEGSPESYTDALVNARIMYSASKIDPGKFQEGEN